MSNKDIKLKGFTLIEILVVIGLIAILAAVTIIAINPGQNFQDARDSERQSEVTQLLNALTQWVIAGNNLADIDDAAAADMVLCTSGSNSIAAQGATAAGTQVDLEAIIAPTYIAAIPGDPTSETATDSGYTICDAGDNRVTIAAPSAEGSVAIEATR